MRAQILTVLLVLTLGIGAQETRPWEQYLNEVMTMEDAESDSWERTYELLCELEQHPLDINRTSREQLEELPFLSAQQIEELMAYRYRYGAMKSLGELLMIRSLGYAQRRLLTYFIYIGETSDDPVKRYGHHELIATGRIPFDQTDDKNYLGYPYRHWLRYQYTVGDDVKIGLVAAQDAGEPFFANRNKWGYDYYSPYLQLRRWGRFETLVLGNYRLSMGMGLVMNNGFSLGKVSMLQTLGRSSNIIHAHASRSDNYLQGAAATMDLGKGLKMTGFISYRAMDATLNKDSTVSTILDNGYHRTEKEMEKKHNLMVMKTGGSLRFQHGGFHLGVNALYVHLSRELKPNTDVLYRRHYPQGTDFMNTSLDYGYTSPRFSLNGETAMDKNGHLATINSLSWRLGDGLSLMALQRFYAYRYTSLDAQSFSDGSRVQNESGVYLGLTWQPSPAWRLAYYSDFAYFAWAKYQVSLSSHAWDHLLQLTHTGKHWTLGARYRLRMKQKDNEDKTALTNRWEHRARLSADYASEQGFGSRTQLDAGYLAYGQGEWGGMLSEMLSYSNNWLRLYAGVGYYHTDSYNSRVYLYERSPLYTYAISSFYGEGIRYLLMARVQIGRSLTLTTKAGVTDNLDLDVQLRWKI